MHPLLIMCFPIIKHMNGLAVANYKNENIMSFDLKKFASIAIGVFATFLLFSMEMTAQVPEGIPDDPYHIDWSNWSDRILFLVLPVIIILLVIVRRRKYLKNK